LFRTFLGQLVILSILVCGSLFAVLRSDHIGAAVILLIAAAALAIAIALSAWIVAAEVSIDNTGIEARTYLGRVAAIRCEDLIFEEYDLPTFGASRKARLAPRTGETFVWITELLEGYDELRQLAPAAGSGQARDQRSAFWERLLMRG
jgi:hypothetical protein